MLLPFLTVLLLLIPELKFKDRFNKVFVTAFFFVFGIFGVVGTRDYMNWNRATQKAWTSLEKKGISMEDIDCGLAFNQFYKKDPYDNAEPYIIAMGEVSGYEKQDSFSFVRNLFLSKGEIYILKRKTNQ